MKKSFFLLSFLILALGLSSCNQNREIKHDFCHHVYFWLNNPDDPADRDAFEQGLTDLLNIPEIKMYHIGNPEPGTAGRGVVDGSYTYSYMVFFDDLEGHDIYQDHPVHLEFVENYSHLWNKVVVFDSVSEL